MRVDPSQVAAAQGHAVPVEELQDLDRDLAAVLDPVAEGGGGEDPAFGRRRQIGDAGFQVCTSF